MPVMDGYATMRAIRAIDRFKALPIVAVTGKVDRRGTPALPRRRRQRLRPEAGRLRRAALLAPTLVPPTSRGRADGGRDEAVAELADAVRPAADSNRRQPTMPLDGLKILVVDDDFRNIFAMTALLERGRADVVVAESGAEAIAQLERRPTSTSS